MSSLRTTSDTFDRCDGEALTGEPTAILTVVTPDGAVVNIDTGDLDTVISILSVEDQLAVPTFLRRRLSPRLLACLDQEPFGVEDADGETNRCTQ